MPRKKKPGGPLKGGSESAKVKGLVGIMIYVEPADRVRIARAAAAVERASVRAFATEAVLSATAAILGKSVKA